MGGRILTLQRQARELGRLRTGYSVPNADPKRRPRPVKSKTWVLSSHAEHYVQAAAGLWGGKVERWQPQGNGAPQFRVITEAEGIDALLPPGDPLNSYNEMWNKGGCARRCNGETELLSRQPCLCAAQFGEDWHLAPKGPKGEPQVCAATSRLNVMLPDMPDLGVWRAETHSFYAANEWGGTVDMVLSGTNGQGMVPVTLRIEPRTRVAGGQTKHFPVVVVEIRGITPRQALTGPLPTAVALDPASAPRLAIEAAKPEPDYLAEARKCRTPDAVIAIWQRVRVEDQARATDQLRDELKAIAEDIGRGVDPEQPEASDEGEEAIEVEFVDSDAEVATALAEFYAAADRAGIPRQEASRRFWGSEDMAPEEAGVNPLRRVAREFAKEGSK